jgi:H+/Cl- antiporter ClcA
MTMTIITHLIALLVGGGAGLLVGRKNPSVAAAAAKMAADAQAKLQAK